MKYDLRRPFLDTDGQPVPDEFGQPTQMADYVSKRLFSLGGEGMTVETMMKLYRIAKKLKTDEVVELGHDEVMLLEEQMSKILTVGAYGQLCDILD